LLPANTKTNPHHHKEKKEVTLKPPRGKPALAGYGFSLGARRISRRQQRRTRSEKGRWKWRAPFHSENERLSVGFLSGGGSPFRCDPRFL
jgi:hypothetical protein